MKKFFGAILYMAITLAHAQEITTKWTGSRPDGHAPITVMGDHTHGKGEFMFSYRYMYMNMEDLNQGSKNALFSDALRPNNVYMVTPTRMPMYMHMLGAMYAPTDKITILVMANYLAQEMDHLTAMGGTFRTASNGFGDLKVGALYKFFNKNKQQLHAQVGVSIPTGSIDTKDTTPASAPNEVLLPYPMQIGSGTVDGILALTYLRQWDHFSIGTQARSTLRFGTNDNEYRLGNKYSINNWIALQAAHWVSFSGRIEVGAIERIEGINPALNPMMVITADTANSGMTYANAGLGFNIYAFEGPLHNLRLGFEAAIPLFQNMNGIQLRNKETITVGLQYAL